jgi:hypothetical protein
MDQVTDVFVLPITIAANCRLWAGVRVELEGLTLTLTPPAVAVSWTAALADLVGSATLVAVMVTNFELLIVEGAVYSPFDKVPIDGELMDQVTAVFELPATVAVNCVVWEAARMAVSGLMLMLTLAPAGGMSWTVALADFVGSATLVAVMVTDCAVLMVEGAV